MSEIFDSFYVGPERRRAVMPRRLKQCRRHRIRTESLISECRSASSRRGGEEISFPEALHIISPSHQAQPQIEK